MSIPLATRAQRGCQFLLDNRNPDGGIPAIRPGDGSGCWTTAESLLAITAMPARSNVTAATDELASFLLGNQIRKGNDAGSWGMVAGGGNGSTMATGHVIAALSSARGLLDTESRSAVDTAIDRAVEWLLSTQVSGQGWGVEPGAGPSGSSPRTVSTYLALLGLAVANPQRYSHSSSRNVRTACEWLRSQRSNGGFPASPESKPDPCSTARVCLALDLAGYDIRSGEILREAEAFVVSQQRAGELWGLDTEVFVSHQGSGETVFHMNTTAELLDLFLHFDLRPEARDDLAHWFADHQNEDGSWYLGANEEEDPNIVTWSTSEAVQILLKYLAMLGPAADHPVPLPATLPAEAKHRVPAKDERAQADWKRATTILLSVVILQLVLLLGLPSFARSSWEGLPGSFRQTVVAALILAVIANVISAILISGMIWLFRRKKNGKEP
jgi:hypothetical protein